MKIYIKFLLVCLSTVCMKMSLFSQETQKQYMSENELRSIARKYNCEDLLENSKNRSYLFGPKTFAEDFFKRESMIRNQYKNVSEQYNGFKINSKHIKTTDDYFNLVEQYSILKENMIEKLGGKTQYEEYKKFIKTNKIKILRDNEGRVILIPINEKDLDYLNSGWQRIDNLTRE